MLDPSNNLPTGKNIVPFTNYIWLLPAKSVTCNGQLDNTHQSPELCSLVVHLPAILRVGLLESEGKDVLANTGGEGHILGRGGGVRERGTFVNSYICIYTILRECVCVDVLCKLYICTFSDTVHFHVHIHVHVHVYTYV